MKTLIYLLFSLFLDKFSFVPFFAKFASSFSDKEAIKKSIMREILETLFDEITKGVNA